MFREAWFPVDAEIFVVGTAYFRTVRPTTPKFCPVVEAGH